MTNSKIQEIIEAFDKFDGTYKREQVNAALEIKEEITPHLIDLLEKIVSTPEKYLKEDRYAHIYAVILLGYFREPKAHKVMVDLFSLPGDIPSQLFGDLVTEALPAILFQTCSGSLELIKALVLNKEAYDYCRTSALDAMVYAVAAGMASRDDVISFFGTLFTGDEAKIDSHFWSALACCVCDLYPEELMDVIKKAYEDGLIFPGYIGYKSFLKTLSEDKERIIDNVKINMKGRMLEDVHKYMSRWACFNEKKETPDPDYAVSFYKALKKKKKKGKNKTKKKMAKASRRKNHR